MFLTRTMILIYQNHSSCWEHQFEPKISGIGSGDLKLWGFKNRWFLTISENLQNSNFPHFAHFDTFWFFSHNCQTNLSILSLKVAQGHKILQLSFAQIIFQKNWLRKSYHQNTNRPWVVGPNLTLISINKVFFALHNPFRRPRYSIWTGHWAR